MGQWARVLGSKWGPTLQGKKSCSPNKILIVKYCIQNGQPVDFYNYTGIMDPHF